MKRLCSICTEACCVTASLALATADQTARNLYLMVGTRTRNHKYGQNHVQFSVDVNKQIQSRPEIGCT